MSLLASLSSDSLSPASEVSESTLNSSFFFLMFLLEQNTNFFLKFELSCYKLNKNCRKSHWMCNVIWYPGALIHILLNDGLSFLAIKVLYIIRTLSLISLQDKPVDLDTEDWECERVKVESNQFLDSFRIFHPSRKNAFTCWNTKMNCR